MKEKQKQVVNATLKGELVKVFQNNQFGNIRTVIIDNKPYFVAVDVAKALGYKDTSKAIKQHCRWVVKCPVPHPQSKNKTLEVNVIPEGDMYRLITNSELPSAEEFEMWVFDEVLPNIRQHGTYSVPSKDVSTALAEFRGQVATLVNDIFDQKMQDVREYYKINSRTKVDISTYIKKRLGIARADEEYEQVKARVFLILNITKWEDLDIDSYSEIMPIVDESIRVIKLDRPQQTSLWD